ncbi:MAG: HAD family hydrolase [Lachnospiraceae bacterium]|nr:HAD family hydrolase [Lachnospiraceae bacterium]
MEKKAIFLDIDGTLTEPGRNEPPASALEAVRRARDGGNYVFLCSGRSYGMLSSLLEYGFDGVIASAGGYIECRGEVIYDCPMTKEQTERAMAVLKEHGVYCTVECMEGAYTDETFKEFLREHEGEGKNSEMLRWQEQIESSFHTRPMAEYLGEPVYKIVIMSRTEEQLEIPRRILEREFVFSLPKGGEFGFVNGELINRQFDKGRGVMRACEYLGIPVERSVAFGDSINDREMLVTAGLGICMENGCQEMKEIADDICPPVTEDGIYRAFEKYHLM